MGLDKACIPPKPGLFEKSFNLGKCTKIKNNGDEKARV